MRSLGYFGKPTGPPGLWLGSGERAADFMYKPVISPGINWNIEERYA
jgi:hypothetical protein